MDQVKKYQKMSVASLKDILRTRDLPLGGKKEALIKRIMQGKRGREDEGDENPEPKRTKGEKASLSEVAAWCQQKIPDLKHLIGERGLKKTGTKGELIVRLYTGERLSKDEEADVMQEIFHKNVALAAHFTKLSEEAGPGHRGNSFRLVSSLLTFYPFVIKSGKEAAKLKGIGKSASGKIQEFLDNGGEAPQPEPVPEPEPQMIEVEAKEADSSSSEQQANGGGDTESLQAKLLVLMSADETDMGLTIADMASKTGATEEDVKSKMESWSDMGKVYSTLDENTFKLDQ